MKNAAATWLATARHEAARAARQRTTSALRRAAALEEGRQAVGSYEAVAEHLGVSTEAVAKAVRTAPTRAPGDPMADYLEHDLPHLGAAVPTLPEWEALPADEQSAAARRAATIWSTIARYAQHQASVTTHLSEEMATCQMEGPADPDDREDGDPYAPRPMPEIVAAAVGPEAAKGVLLEGDETISALQRTLADLAASWRQHSRTAWDQHARWAQRAGDSRGMHFAE